MVFKIGLIGLASAFLFVSCKQDSHSDRDSRVEQVSAQSISVGEPTLNLTAAGGCGNFGVHAMNPEHTEALVVSIDRKALGISTEEKTFQLADHAENISIHLEQSRSDIEERLRFFICDDQVFPNRVLPKTWKALEGTVTVKISEDAPALGVEYKATVHLKDVKIVDPDTGETKTIEALDFDEISVGWLPG